MSSKEAIQRRLQEQGRFEVLRDAHSEGGSLWSVGLLLERAAARRTTAPALFLHDRQLSYAEWYACTRAFAAVLTAQGVGVGERVLLCAPNSLEFLIAYTALWHCGAVVVPLNTYFHEKELAQVLGDAGSRFVIVTSETRARFLPLCEQFSQYQLIDADGVAEVPLAAPATRPVCRPDEETAVLLYTSGTTGTPKGVLLSGANVVSNALQCMTRFIDFIGADEHERFFGVLPFFHVFSQNTCIWLPLLLGAAVVVVPRIDRREIVLGLRNQPTVFLGFPALYGLLLLMRTADLSSVKLFVSGADALPDKIRIGFELLYGRKICSGYGLSEASPVVAVAMTNADLPSHFVGDVLPGTEIVIRTENGEVARPGEVGELFVRGPQVMQGYLHAPEATAAVLSSDGWLATGDLALLDEDGHLAICGRSKDVIISKGFNIYPQEVENVLLRHPRVVKAAVIGVEDELHGQSVIAFVAARPPQSLSSSELRAFCGEHLASYKVPRVCIVRDDLPLLPTGKIDKKTLKAEYRS